MRDKGSHIKIIDRNWATKRKRKRLPCGPDLCDGKESSSAPLEPPRNNHIAKHRLDIDSALAQSQRKKKGEDGYYYECVVCDLGGNLLCCDSCPRTYHLQCLNPPLKRTPPGKWQCPTCCEQNGCLRSIRNSESTSKQTGTKITIKTYKSENKSSGSNKALEIVKSCIPEEIRSSCSEKPPSSLKILFVKRKSVSSHTDASQKLESSHASYGESVKGTPPENAELEGKPNMACMDTSGNEKSNRLIKEVQSCEMPEIQSNSEPSERRLDPPCNEFPEEMLDTSLGLKKSKKRKKSKSKDSSERKAIHSFCDISEVQSKDEPSERKLDLCNEYPKQKLDISMGCTLKKSTKRKRSKGKEPSVGKFDRPSNEFPEKKLDTTRCTVKKSKKKKQHKGKKVCKKDPRDADRKNVLKTSDKCGKRLISSSPEKSKSCQEGNFIDNQVPISPSREDLREKSSVIHQKDVKFLGELPQLSNESDGTRDAHDKRTIEENALVELQQVDRILACRVQSVDIRSLEPVEHSTSPSDVVSKFFPPTPESSKKFVDDNPAGNKAVNVEDAENSQSGVNRSNSEKNIENNAKADKLHVYRRSGAKKYIHGDAGSTWSYTESQGLSAVNAAAPDESAENIDDSSKVNENLPSVESTNVKRGTLGAQGDCTILKTSEGNTQDADSDTNSKARTKEEPILENLMPSNRDITQFEFLVKWVGQSHIHNSWISEAQLKILAKRKLENYKAKYGTAVITIFREEWSQPQRVISLRSSKGVIAEAFIKWSGLPYDECTWERLDEPAIEKCSHLVAEFERFEQQTLDNDAAKADLVKSKSESHPGEILPLAQQPKELKGGLLFQHQLEALNWLRKCWHKSKNVILADEMGLGKTVSACAFISSLYIEFKAKLPCLVLVPLSTMPNWLSEFALWAPHLNVVEYHGGARARSTIRLYEWHANYPDCLNKRTKSYKFNVLLTTYEMVLADSSHLRGVPWEVLIVDEGHRLKNSESKLFGLLNSFSFQHRILLTGTPLQNNIGEMYNLLNFLQPASFPSLSAFEQKFKDLTSAEKVEELKKLVAPHMLRRLKKDVMQNIPPKTERMVPVELSSIQAEYYRAMLTKNYQILRNIGKGVAQQSMLNIVMQLRKVCNHPYLIPGTEPDSGSVDFLHEMRIKASAKLTLLHSMLRLLHKEGHRVLIFSQMTKLLDILEDYLNVEYGPKTFERVDGSVSSVERQAAIARFNHDKSRFIFLLSTRSCGLGINLATADTVIIYDSDFNPHADIQAMNRAHRIGQSNRLLVYRLVVRASVEERILQLAKRKLMLDQLFANKSGSQKEVEDILRWGTEQLFSDPCTGTGNDKSENPSPKDDENTDTESKQRRRLGGLGDVYKDKCTDGNAKILWDENAILKLLDRSVLQSVPSEAAEGDLENDMLGSVKSLEWNDDPVEEQVRTDFPSAVAEDEESENIEKKEEQAPVGTEENEWDRLLRGRWEKYQSEEEAALGRGKRLRKAISYSEAFAQHPTGTVTENGNEEEVQVREYTPAGRALKAKFAKLRTRQKERLSQRNMVGGSEPSEGQFGPEPPPQYSPIEAKVGETEPADLAREPISKVVNGESSHPVDAAKCKSGSHVGYVTGLRNSQKSNLNSHLVLAVTPPVPSTSDIVIPNHLSQSSGYVSSVPPNNLLPVLGLCAPNANRLESGNRKKHESENPARPNYNQSRKGKKLPDFPFSLDAGAGTSSGMDIKSRESGGGTCNLPDAPPEYPRRFQSSILDSIFSFTSHPLIDTHGRGPYPFETGSTFQDRMALPNLTFDENHRSKFSRPANEVSNPGPDLLPNLSLGTEIDTTIQDIPTRPFLPDFRFLPQEMPKLDRRAREVPPVLGLGLMHGTNTSLPENHKKVLDNIMMRTGSGMQNSFKKRFRASAWTEDELDALWIGVRRYGRGNWDAMLRDPKLKFSKYRTSEEMSARWEEELVKINNVAVQTAPKSAKPSFLGISDEMMTRALHGSGFSGFEGDCFAHMKSRSHLTDMRLGYGHPAPGRLPVDPSDQFRNGNYAPLPSWKCDEFQSLFRGEFSAGPSNRPASTNLQHPFLFSSLPTLGSMGLHHPSKNDLQQKEVERGANKYAKLPIPDKPLSCMHDSHTNLHVGDSVSSKLLPGSNKQPYFCHPPVKGDASGSDSATNKLPHWLREAVSSPAIPPEPVLPPTVLAIAHSVRLLYGEEKPTIPPFTVPGPPPSLPKDPRMSLKKKRKSHKVKQATPDIAISKNSEKSTLGEVDAASSNPLPPPLPSLMARMPPSASPCVETNNNFCSLNLNLMTPESLSPFLNHRMKSGIVMSPSPEVLKLAASCAAPDLQVPSVPDMLSSTPLGADLHLFKPSKASDIRESREVKSVNDEHKSEQILRVGDLGQVPEGSNGRTESGDSSKTHSDHPLEEHPDIDDASSEETVSNTQRSEQEQA